jgi:hypothetical protein
MPVPVIYERSTDENLDARQLKVLFGPLIDAFKRLL